MNKTEQKQYYVLIADLENSQKYEDDKRCVIQDILIKASDFINYHMEQTWSSNSLSGKYKLQCGLEFCGGDSVMCLSDNLETLCECIKLLKLALNTIPVRFAIGKGEWTVMIPGKGINYQDGEAFWNARLAMNHCKGFSNIVDIPCDFDLQKELVSQVMQIEKCATDEELEEMFQKIIDGNIVDSMKGCNLPFKLRD